MDMQSSNKRARLEEPGNDNADKVVAQPHHKYWFEDGNVILQAESMQFKVHRSVLSNQSPVFNDMFSIPQPVTLSKANSTPDNSPVVVLHDSTEDIENLLSLLYDTMRVHNFRGKMSISVLRTMLRLGRKYRFRHFRAEALHCLKQEFPSTLMEWESKNGFKYIQGDQMSIQVLFDIVYIAHENSIKCILPVVYSLLCLKFKKPASFKDLFTRLQDNHFLRTDEPLTFLQGREKFFCAVPQITFKWLTEMKVPCAQCTQPDLCSYTAKDIIQGLWLVGVPPVDFAVVPSPLKDLFCSPCRELGQSLYDAGRQKVWDALPEYFGLNNENWNEEDSDNDEEDNAQRD